MLGYLAYLSALYCFLLFYAYLRAKKLNLDISTTLDFAVVIMIFGFWGSRLFHVFYENPEVYAADWKRVFYFWQGGFVYYGGVIVGFLACLAMALKRGLPVRVWMDFFAPIMALGYGLGRVSCLIAGCCYGQICDLPWAINHRHPTQIYAVIWELALWVLLLVLERRRALKVGQLFWLYAALHSIGRMMMEHYRDDFRGGLLLGQSVATWISAVFLIIAIIGWIATARMADSGLNAKKGSRYL